MSKTSGISATGGEAPEAVVTDGIVQGSSGDDHMSVGYVDLDGNVLEEICFYPDGIQVLFACKLF